MSDASQGPGWWQAADGRWYAPELHPDVLVPPAGAPDPLASSMTKRRLLAGLAQGKYRQPFETGNAALSGTVGDGWNDYVQVVLAMLQADTLLNIEDRLIELTHAVGELSERMSELDGRSATTDGSTATG